MAQVKITVRRNGPFRVEAPEGTIELVDADGDPYDLTGKTAFSLCRCGGSVNKPFCDGTHSKIGFQAAEAAVKKADETRRRNRNPAYSSRSVLQFSMRRTADRRSFCSLEPLSDSVCFRLNTGQRFQHCLHLGGEATVRRKLQVALKFRGDILV